jgi:hypothetical protein
MSATCDSAGETRCGAHGSSPGEARRTTYPEGHQTMSQEDEGSSLDAVPAEAGRSTVASIVPDGVTSGRVA